MEMEEKGMSKPATGRKGVHKAALRTTPKETDPVLQRGQPAFIFYT